MNLKEKAVSGVKWNTIATIYIMVLQVLRLSVLTYLLDKSDFGLVAIATMVISFTDIFSDLGLTVAIIHKQDISTKQYSSLFWMNIITSVFLFLLVIIASPFLSTFYNQPVLKTIIPLLGTQILFNAFGKMFQTIKTKNLEFRFISKVRILTNTSGVILTISLALVNFGVYSLVFGQIFQVLLTQIIFAIAGLKGQKIIFYFRLNEIKDFIKIGSYQLGAKFLDFISAQIDVFLIGKFFDMSDLGVYNIAKDLILKPFQIISSLVNNVTSSVFAKIQDNILMIRDNYKKILKIISVISVPIYTITIVFAETIVEILYSSSFSDVAIFLRILSIVGLITSFNSIAGTLQIALGRTDIGFKWTLIRVFVSTSLILITSYFSIIAVAYGQLILSIVFYFIYWRMAIYSLIKLKLFEYIKIILTPLLSSIIISLPFIVLLEMIDINLILQITLIISFLLMYVLYYFVWHKDFVNNILKLLVGNRIKK